MPRYLSNHHQHQSGRDPASGFHTQSDEGSDPMIYIKKCPPNNSKNKNENEKRTKLHIALQVHRYRHPPPRHSRNNEKPAPVAERGGTHECPVPPASRRQIHKQAQTPMTTTFAKSIYMPFVATKSAYRQKRSTKSTTVRRETLAHDAVKPSSSLSHERERTLLFALESLSTSRP